jgi:hypothetical protein
MCGSYLPKDDPKPHLKKRKVVIDDPREIEMLENFRREQPSQSAAAMAFDLSLPSAGLLPEMEIIAGVHWSDLAMAEENGVWSGAVDRGIEPILALEFSESAWKDPVGFVREW